VGGDSVAPELDVTNPSLGTVITTAAYRVIQGTASDNEQLASVAWENSLGGGGTAIGLNDWTAVIPLKRGFNRITITATDAAGNTSWRTITITRR
jgi:hypothetical protein